MSSAFISRNHENKKKKDFFIVSSWSLLYQLKIKAKIILNMLEIPLWARVELKKNGGPVQKAYTNEKSREDHRYTAITSLMDTEQTVL